MFTCLLIPVQTPVTLNSVLLFSHFVHEASKAATATKNAIFFIVVSIRSYKDVNIYASFDKASSLSKASCAFKASRPLKLITSLRRWPIAKCKCCP